MAVTPEGHKEEGGGTAARWLPSPHSSQATVKKPQVSSLRPLCEAMTDQQCGLTSLT